MTTTEQIKTQLGETLTRRTGNSWITTDELIIEISNHPLNRGNDVFISCPQCGAYANTTMTNAAMKLDAIRKLYH